MATKKSLEYVQITDVSLMYVGKEYFLKMDCHMKYTKQSVRDIIKKDHKAGIHTGETIDEYNRYRNQIDSWVKNGWIYEAITSDIEDPKPQKAVRSNQTKIVDPVLNNKPQIDISIDI